MLLYKLLGFIFVGIASIGLFVPLLPTTPFLLLAAACFVRSSEKWYNWLISNKVFGSMIINWQEKKCIPYSTKVFIILLIIIFGAYSVLFLVSGLILKIFGALLVATGLFFVCQIRVCRNENA
jgi:uncharacterized protein